MIQGVKFPEKMANLSVTDCEAIDRHYQQDTMQAGDGGSVMGGGSLRTGWVHWSFKHVIGQ